MHIIGCCCLLLYKLLINLFNSSQQWTHNFYGIILLYGLSEKWIQKKKRKIFKTLDLHKQRHGNAIFSTTSESVRIVTQFLWIFMMNYFKKLQMKTSHHCQPSQFEREKKVALTTFPWRLFSSMTYTVRTCNRISLFSCCYFSPLHNFYPAYMCIHDTFGWCKHIAMHMRMEREREREVRMGIKLRDFCNEK